MNECIEPKVLEALRKGGQRPWGRGAGGPGQIWAEGLGVLLSPLLKADQAIGL